MKIAQYLNDVKTMLDMEDTTLYDRKLSICIDSAILELKIEGIEEPTSPQDEIYNMYVVLLAYRVALNIDIDVNSNDLRTLYITAVNTLRAR